MLAAGLEALPEPMTPLDVAALDGFLCGVLVQPRPPPRARWLPLLFADDGQALPAPAELDRLGGFIDRRYAELQTAIAGRQWFDPWVFADEEARHAADDESGVDTVASGGARVGHDTGAETETETDAVEADADAIATAVSPWVVGLAGALAAFPALLAEPSDELDQALAAAFRFLDPEELEDAAGLFAAIEMLEPASSLEEAVEGLTRSVLLLADIGAALRPGRV